MVLTELGLNVGDPINYSRRGKHNNAKHFGGIITQISKRNIAVKLKRYPDSISLSELADETVMIDGISKLTVTTSEVNTPYRPENELRRETPQTSEYEIKGETQKTKEDEKVMGFERDLKKNPLTREELTTAWEVANQKINPVAKLFGISWQDAKNLLKDAGLLENYRGVQPTKKKTEPPKEKEKAKSEPPKCSECGHVFVNGEFICEPARDGQGILCESCYEDSLPKPKEELVKCTTCGKEMALNDIKWANTIFPGEEFCSEECIKTRHSQVQPLLNAGHPPKPTLSLHEDGTINWPIMWPIVKPGLEAGRDKFEVADIFGIPHSAMQKKFYKMVTKPAQLAKKESVKSECQASSGLEEYQGLSRDELLAMRLLLKTKAGQIDIILSCIEATLAEVRTDAEV